jgi:predicted DsbA family dithiol-disulfide isomerase
MTVEIWGDVTCSFCYIAKQNFEVALSQFEGKESIDIVSKSFELMPNLETDPNKRLPQVLSEMKGTNMETVKGMTDHVENIAREVGLVINSNSIIPANSMNAHRLIHLAKAYGLQEKAKEILFEAYFVRGENIDDYTTLSTLAIEIGLDKPLVESALKTEKYISEVQEDLALARKNGITSVPFYVINQQTKISGAQDSEVYLEALKKSFETWKTETGHATPEQMQGLSCDVSGSCY